MNNSEDTDYFIQNEIAHLKEWVNHPGIIKYIETMDLIKYVLIITEMHGTRWDSQNQDLSTNPGLEFYPGDGIGSGEERKWMDLHDCIAARNLYIDF